MTGAGARDLRRAARRLLLMAREESLSAEETAALLDELQAFTDDLEALDALPLDYATAAGPDHVQSWVEAGGRCAACERAGRSHR